MTQMHSVMYIGMYSETMGSEGEGNARADEEAQEWAVNIRIQFFSW